MAKTGLKQLKKVAENVAKETSQEKKIEFLTQAFALFKSESEKLEQAYQQLKEQFNKTDELLADTSEQFNKKLVELDAITYYLNSILSNISQGILFINLNGDITTYNEAAQSILQISSQKILFHSFWENFKDDCFGFSMRQILLLQQPIGTVYTTFGTKELEVENSFILKKGEVKGSPIDAMQGMILLIRDITEMRRLQLMASRADRLKELGEMAAMVAHEIRNPLGGIKGFASLLYRDLVAQPELQEMARYIIEGTDHLNLLVSKVLNYARPIQPQIEIVDLLALVKELFQLVKADSNLSSKVNLILESAHHELFIPIDAQLMRSALLNLLVNALQAMPNGGDLILNLQSKAHQTFIKIKDTGIGISKENIKKLFTPFFTTRIDGNGFGLAEVLKIVQAHGGTIQVQSEVNQGTEFTIILPEKFNG